MVSGESRVLAPPTRPQVTQQTPAVAATLAAAYRLTDGRGRTSSCLLQNTAQLQGLTDWSVWLSHNYYYYYHNSSKIPAQSHSVAHFTSSEQLKHFCLNRLKKCNWKTQRRDSCRAQTLAKNSPAF